jgi:hypothetical protein
VKWLTTLGWISVEEQQWRLGRRGKILRPFCVGVGVESRGTSRRMQRAMVDFGADVSFAEAAKKIDEHYGIDVSVGRVRRHSLHHGKQLSAVAVEPPKTNVGTVVTQLDGSMIPIVETTEQKSDRRKGKKLFWRETRLCLAREKESASPVYGATLGSAGIAGELWRQIAQAAGAGPETQIHGVGDGAEWITTQFREQFGERGTYLLDFWHVSDYLANAATVVQPNKAVEWRHRQQGRLLENKSNQVLKALAAHLEPESQKEAPVRAAHSYLKGRSNQLDYFGARKSGLPIGSGEVEGGHRHIIQERLKLTGCWWKEPNAQAMLGLRVGRANCLWNSYWKGHSASSN